jgi:hypothetical protein
VLGIPPPGEQRSRSLGVTAVELVRMFPGAAPSGLSFRYFWARHAGSLDDFACGTYVTIL